MTIDVRPAELNQLEVLMNWRMAVLREVFALPAEAMLNELEAANRAYYQAKIPTGEHLACFAYQGQDIVGCGGVCFQQEMPSPDNPSGRCAYLMNIYTRPDRRGQGVGRAVVCYLTRQAQERGVSKIYLEASASGRPLYAKLGFEEMGGYMIFKNRSSEGQ